MDAQTIYLSILIDLFMEKRIIKKKNYDEDLIIKYLSVGKFRFLIGIVAAAI